jgi:hypothetical protein
MCGGLAVARITERSPVSEIRVWIVVTTATIIDMLLFTATPATAVNEGMGGFVIFF